MKLIEVIDHLKSIAKAEKLISIEIPNVEFGLVDIYLKNKLDVESEVTFFDVDTIPNNLVIEVNGTSYINLFPLAMTQEMIEDYSRLTNPQLSDAEIAQKLLDYRINDA